MLIELDGKGALYLQLYRALKQRILAGVLREGERLPASRTLARSLGISRNVVLLGYEQLASEGYIESRVGSGTRVAKALPETTLQAIRRASTSRIGQPPSARLSPQAATALGCWQARKAAADQPEAPFDFRYGDVDVDPQSLKLWRRLSSGLFGPEVLQYGDPQGEPALREIIADYARRGRGCDCTASQVCIVNGSQQALDIIARLLDCKSRRVVVEEPGYLGASNLFQAAGAKLVPVSVDQEGIRIGTLPAAGSAVGLIYVTPSHQFPTGAIMSLSRRLELLDWAEQADSYIIEDDYDGEFRYQGRPIASLQGLDSSGRTLYVGTFSKVLFPGLRIGYVILPEPLVEPFVALRWLSDRHTPTHQQQVLAAFIRGGDYERHLRRMCKRYESRRQALIAALEARFGDQIELHGINAGLHLLVWFRDPALQGKEQQLMAAARASGIGIYPVSPLYRRPPERVGLLFGYGGIDEQRITTGIARLQQVVVRLLAEGEASGPPESVTAVSAP